MNHSQISGKLDWSMDENVLPLTSTGAGFPVHDVRFRPNAYSAILGVLQADHKGYALTHDQQIVEISKNYKFIHISVHDKGEFRVAVFRGADELPEIYRWLADYDVNLSQVAQVPWVHPMHTIRTWGHCPYCEHNVTHENWPLHRYAECLGQGSLDQELMAFPTDFSQHRSVAQSSRESLNDPRGILRLFRWKKLMKTAAGTYVLWGNTFPENTAIRTMPELYVYGSTPNQIQLRKGRYQREDIMVNPVVIGTTIHVSLHRLVQKDLYYWGKI